MVAILVSTVVFRQLWSNFGECRVICYHESCAMDQFGECMHLDCSMADFFPLRYHFISDLF